MIKLLLVIVITTSIGVGCGPQTTSQPPEQANIPSSQLGQKVRCPVMSQQGEFTVMPNTASMEYKGKIYYFCCGGCKKTFKKNPEKYAD